MQTAVPAECWARIRVEARALRRGELGGRDARVVGAVEARLSCLRRRRESPRDVRLGRGVEGGRSLIGCGGEDEEGVVKEIGVGRRGVDAGDGGWAGVLERRLRFGAAMGRENQVNVPSILKTGVEKQWYWK